MDIDKINEAYYKHLRLLKESDPLGRDPEDIDPNLDDDPDIDPEDEDAEGKIPAKYAYDLKRAQGEHPQAPITLQQTAQHLQMLELYLRTNVMAALMEGNKNEGKKVLNGLLQHILQPLIKAIQNTQQMKKKKKNIYDRYGVHPTDWEPNRESDQEPSITFFPKDDF